MTIVTMTCMTTKKKFDVEDPPVLVLKNNRYAYRVECPWTGKNGKQLFAFKFCSTDAYKNSLGTPERPESPEDEPERPESPESEA